MLDRRARWHSLCSDLVIVLAVACIALGAFRAWEPLGWFMCGFAIGFIGWGLYKQKKQRAG